MSIPQLASIITLPSLQFPNYSKLLIAHIRFPQPNPQRSIYLYTLLGHQTSHFLPLPPSHPPLLSPPYSTTKFPSHHHPQSLISNFNHQPTSHSESLHQRTPISPIIFLYFLPLPLYRLPLTFPYLPLHRPSSSLIPYPQHKPKHPNTPHVLLLQQ
jgi:hypothetical protein